MCANLGLFETDNWMGLFMKWSTESRLVSVVGYDLLVRLHKVIHYDNQVVISG